MKDKRAFILSEHDHSVLRTDLKKATDVARCRIGDIATLIDARRYAEAERLIPEIRDALQIIVCNTHTLGKNTP